MSVVSPTLSRPAERKLLGSATLAAAGLALIWAGLVVGVSFVATPAKFLAPSLSLPVALEVGSHTFGLFVRIELVLGVILAALGLWAGPGRPWQRAAWLAPLLVVLLQILWLLPLLDMRLQLVIEGGTPPPSHLHLAYIGLELAKIGVLVGLGASSLRHVALPASRA